MQILRLPALQGALWLRDGWRLFKRQPIGLTAMSVFYLLILFVPLLLPPAFLGVAVSTALTPFAAIGLMNACREIAQGRAPTVVVFSWGFRDPGTRNRLLVLGLVNVALAMLLATLFSLLGLEAVQVEPGTPPDSVGWQHVSWPALLAQLLALAPVFALMWFSPMLVAWHGMAPAKAMFGSAVACVRNLAALFVYGNAVVVFVFVTSFVVLGGIGLLTNSQTLQSMVVAPVALVVVSIVQASFYTMYTSIFATD